MTGAQMERAIKCRQVADGSSCAATADTSIVAVEASARQAAPDDKGLNLAETYVGDARAERFVSPGGITQDGAQKYAEPKPDLTQWGLDGT